MKISESNYHFTAKFKEDEKELIDMLGKKLPLLGVNYSKDRLTWKIRIDLREKFNILVNNYMEQITLKKYFK